MSPSQIVSLMLGVQVWRRSVGLGWNQPVGRDLMPGFQTRDVVGKAADDGQPLRPPVRVLPGALGPGERVAGIDCSGAARFDMLYVVRQKLGASLELEPHAPAHGNVVVGRLPQL